MQTELISRRPARRSIGVRDLLTHTAGIHHGFASVDSVMGTLYERSGVVHDARQPLDEKIRRLGPLPLAHDPGTAWTYGLCSDVAARLVETITGEPFDRYLAREILGPLGMDTTTYFVPAGHHHRIAARHARAPAGGLTPMSRQAYRHEMSHVSGGGGLYATVDDYARLAQALLDGGAPVLSPPSVQAMTSVQTPHVTSLGLRYGLSVGLSMADARGTYPLPIGGFGWYGIFGTWFWAWPAHRAVVLLFSHVLDSTMSFPLFSGVATAVERRLAGSTGQEDRR